MVTLTIPSQIGFEKVALSVVRGLGTALGLPRKKIDRLKTALAEATLNAIEHGNQSDERLNVTIQFIHDPTKLVMIVADCGRSANITVSKEKPDINLKVLGLDRPRGWGLFLIAKLVDEFKVDTVPGQGNLIRMVSYL